MFVEVAAPAAATEGRVRAARPSVLRRMAAAAPPYLFLLPALICIVVWTYRPLAQTAQLSTYRWNLLPTTPMVPVGASNYQQVLQMPELRESIITTVIYIVGLLPFSIVLPVIVALISRRVRGRGRAFYQSLIFVPTLMTPVATAAVWRWLLDPSGAVNSWLHVIGLNKVNWLQEPRTALFALIVITGWQMLGFAVLIVSAGLANINGDYHSAAELDGASSFQSTRWITLPLLSPTLLFLALMTVLLSAQWTFPLIDILTQGGPDNTTMNVYYLLWKFGFRTFDAGFAASAGVLFFAGFGIIALIFVWLTNRFSFYDN
jgi:multiple sugar transport system permease protein